MKFSSHGREIRVSLPACTDGKFRFKTRPNNLDFGEGFAARQKKFTDKVYLEWQIGYDATIQDVAKGKKVTTLSDQTFIGSNRKEKYLFELAELTHEAMRLGLISAGNIEKTIDEISRCSTFIGNMKIEVEQIGEIELSNIVMKESVIKLPTLYLPDLAGGAQIEISVQKQQYATGVQPMVYYCIPLSSFSNGAGFLGRASNPGDELTYVIDMSNAGNLMILFRIFGMCSKSHNHDVREILRILASHK